MKALGMSIELKPYVALRCAATAAVSTGSSIAMLRLLAADPDVVLCVA